MSMCFPIFISELTIGVGIVSRNHHIMLFIGYTNTVCRLAGL